MVRFLLSCALAGMALRALAQGPRGDAQIEQARQFSSLPTPLDFAAPALSELPGADPLALPDDAFGAQVIFKRQARATPFTAFAEVSAFFTNNVALAKRDRLDDKFLVVAAGAAFTHRLGYDLRVEAGLRVAMYRYAEYRELDFQSVDATLGVVWSPPALHGAEVSLGYAVTQLTSAEEREEFYKSHAVLLGVRKVIPFSRAHAAYFGVGAQWSWAEPQEPGRDEYTAFAGYHLQATEHLEGDLAYRYGHFVYRQGDGRQDDNHTLSLTLRYVPVPWASISATSFLGINKSNRSVFDYEVWNAGIGLQFSVKF